MYFFRVIFLYSVSAVPTDSPSWLLPPHYHSWDLQVKPPNPNTSVSFMSPFNDTFLNDRLIDHPLPLNRLYLSGFLMYPAHSLFPYPSGSGYMMAVFTSPFAITWGDSSADVAQSPR